MFYWSYKLMIHYSLPLNNHFIDLVIFNANCAPGMVNKMLTPSPLFHPHWMKKLFFVLQKLVKRAEKNIFLLVFVCFRFTEISYFLSFPSKENLRKQHLSANAYFCINMKFSYTIAGRKYETSYVVL